MKRPFSMAWHQFWARHYIKRYTSTTENRTQIWVCSCDRLWKR